MSAIEQQIQSRLFELQDLKYRDFHSKLMPTVPKETVIGVRTPALRKYAKELAKDPAAAEFMDILPHKYYEENNLHGFLIESMKDYGEVIAALERFLPYVDNWATCDMVSPKVFKKHRAELLGKAQEWIASGRTYTVRYGLGMLMQHFLDEDFQESYLVLAAGVSSEEYYVNMMVAWYFATALAKQWEAAIPYLEQRRLSQWIHNRTIQKAVESYRVAPEQKEYLRGLRWKG